VATRVGPASVTPRYGDPMTASWSFDERPRTGDPLLPGAAPAAIRDALLPEDRAAFEADTSRRSRGVPGHHASWAPGSMSID